MKNLIHEYECEHSISTQNLNYRPVFKIYSLAVDRLRPSLPPTVFHKRAK